MDNHFDYDGIKTFFVQEVRHRKGWSLEEREKGKVQ